MQYRETDFNFVSRLMEEEGIYYFFEHTNAKHVLVLCDSPSAHQPVSGYENISTTPPINSPSPIISTAGNRWEKSPRASIRCGITTS